MQAPAAIPSLRGIDGAADCPATRQSLDDGSQYAMVIDIEHAARSISTKNAGTMSHHHHHPHTHDPIDPDTIRIGTRMIPDDGRFPGNPDLPLVIYKNALSSTSTADFEDLFRNNGWSGTWRNGIFPYHHYHSTAHEVLGMAKGHARVQFGGRNGVEILIETGDAVVIPAGVAHKNLEHSEDYLVIGAYPSGEIWDIHTGIEGERPRSDENIAQVVLPGSDPIFGERGPLHELWRLSGNAS